MLVDAFGFIVSDLLVSAKKGDTKRSGMILLQMLNIGIVPATIPTIGIVGIVAAVGLDVQLAPGLAKKYKSIEPAKQS